MSGLIEESLLLVSFGVAKGFIQFYQNGRILHQLKFKYLERERGER